MSIEDDDMWNHFMYFQQWDYFLNNYYYISKFIPIYYYIPKKILFIPKNLTRDIYS